MTRFMRLCAAAMVVGAAFGVSLVVAAAQTAAVVPAPDAGAIVTPIIATILTAVGVPGATFLAGVLWQAWSLVKSKVHQSDLHNDQSRWKDVDDWIQRALDFVHAHKAEKDGEPAGKPAAPGAVLDGDDLDRAVSFLKEHIPEKLEPLGLLVNSDRIKSLVKVGVGSRLRVLATTARAAAK